jgi:hypothetical protein
MVWHSITVINDLNHLRQLSSTHTARAAFVESTIRALQNRPTLLVTPILIGVELSNDHPHLRKLQAMVEVPESCHLPGDALRNLEVPGMKPRGLFLP